MNPIKSIVQHACADTRWDRLLRFGASLALEFDADLTTLYAVEPACSTFAFALGGSREAVELLKGLERTHCERARREYALHAAGLDARMHWAAIEGARPAQAVSQRGLLADLLIVTQQEPDARAASSGLPPHFVESVIVGTSAPTLVIPHREPPLQLGHRVLVAWNHSREAGHALAGALPFLKRATSVHVASWPDPRGVDTRPLVETYLRCHGIDIQWHQGSSQVGPASVGEEILTLAAELSSDLLVMGCYGHSEAAEHRIGGVTRSVLASMSLPVLMAH